CEGTISDKANGYYCHKRQNTYGREQCGQFDIASFQVCAPTSQADANNRQRDSRNANGEDAGKRFQCRHQQSETRNTNQPINHGQSTLLRPQMFQIWYGLSAQDHSQDKWRYKHTPRRECDGCQKGLVETNFRIRIRTPPEWQGMNEAAQPMNHRQAHDVTQGQSYGHPPNARVDQKGEQNAEAN